MSKVIIATMLLVSNAYSGLDNKILIKGIITSLYVDKKFVSIRDNYRQEYLLPREGLIFQGKSKTRFITEITPEEVKAINKYCLKNKKINRKLCLK